MKLPDRLRLNKDGSLTLDDGGDVNKYLKEFANLLEIKKGEQLPMTLMMRSRALKLEEHFQYSLVG